MTVCRFQCGMVVWTVLSASSFGYDNKWLGWIWWMWSRKVVSSCHVCCRRYVVHRLVGLEKSSAAELQQNCDADLEYVATKKTKLLSATCSHENECHVPTVCREVDYCNQLLNDPHVSKMQWHTALIQRHLAWTHRFCQSKSSPVMGFHNSLSVWFSFDCSYCLWFYRVGHVIVLSRNVAVKPCIWRSWDNQSVMET